MALAGWRAAPVTGPAAGSNRAPLLILAGGLVLGLVVGLLVFIGPPALPGFAGGPAAGPTATPAPAPVVGAPAPNFTLTDLDGRAVTLSDLRGQVVLLNFWATWCGPCRLEMPLLQAAHEAYHEQGLTILAVDLDDPLADVQAFRAELGLTFPLLLDPGTTVTDLYRVRGWPTSYVINRDGLVSRQHLGALDADQLNEYLAAFSLGG
ncbi:MAG: TlpA family protein disulfide reductase [Anaerolineales bacterium]|nr:TlpA family protein disulfide reductase [Anaerolineales bacterium]